MSTSPIAIARAYDGEPLRRVVVDANEKVYYIANPRSLAAVISGTSGAIGFPRHDCFAWDAEAFTRLSALYEQTGVTEQSDWDGLAPFTGEPLLPPGYRDKAKRTQ